MSARSRHSQALLDELASFPHGAHDDCVDALAGAHTALNKYGTTYQCQMTVPEGTIELGPQHPDLGYTERDTPHYSIAEQLAQAFGRPARSSRAPRLAHRSDASY